MVLIKGVKTCIVQAQVFNVLKTFFFTKLECFVQPSLIFFQALLVLHTKRFAPVLTTGRKGWLSTQKHSGLLLQIVAINEASLLLLRRRRKKFCFRHKILICTTTKSFAKNLFNLLTRHHSRIFENM